MRSDDAQHKAKMRARLAANAARHGWKVGEVVPGLSRDNGTRHVPVIWNGTDLVAVADPARIAAWDAASSEERRFGISLEHARDLASLERDMLTATATTTPAAALDVLRTAVKDTTTTTTTTTEGTSPMGNTITIHRTAAGYTSTASYNGRPVSFQRHPMPTVREALRFAMIGLSETVRAIPPREYGLAELMTAARARGFTVSGDGVKPYESPRCLFVFGGMRCTSERAHEDQHASGDGAQKWSDGDVGVSTMPSDADDDEGDDDGEQNEEEARAAQGDDPNAPRCPSMYANTRCDRPKGHKGIHASGMYEWKNEASHADTARAALSRIEAAIAGDEQNRRASAKRSR
jgi:hypothetical protein